MIAEPCILNLKWARFHKKELTIGEQFCVRRIQRMRISVFSRRDATRRDATTRRSDFLAKYGADKSRGRFIGFRGIVSCGLSNAKPTIEPSTSRLRPHLPCGNPVNTASADTPRGK